MNRHADSIEVRFGWVVIFVSLLIHSIGLGAPSILFVSLKPIAADLDTLRSIPSMAYSLLMLGAGVGGVAMGWWMDRQGILRPVLFGSVMVGLGALLASRAESPTSLFVANGVLIGLLGKSAMIAPLVANATRWFDRRRGLAVAIIASGQGVAGAIWPPIVRYMNDAVGWRGTYYYFGLLALVTMVPLAFVLKPKPPVSSHDTATKTITNGRHQVLGWSASTVTALMWIAVIGCCTAMAMPIVHLVSYATDLGHPSIRAAEVLSVLFAAGFVSRIAFGILSDRIGPMVTLLIGSSCQAIMLATFSVVQSLPGLYLAALLFGLGFSGIMPCYPLIIRLLFPAGQAGWRIASQYLFAALGMALGGWLGGVVFDLTGSYADAFLVGVCFNLINLGIVLTLMLRFRTHQLAPQPA